MVRFRNVSAYRGVTTSEAPDRKIAGGPCYPLGLVKKIAGKENGVLLVTKQSITDASDLGVDASGIGDLILELTEAGYIASEWCETTPGYWAACDGYQLDRNEFLDAISRFVTIQYYLKFYINTAETILMMVSNHLPRVR